MQTKIRNLWDSLKSSYWFIPVIMMVLVLVLWLGTSTLDKVLTRDDKKAITWLYLSDADSMRTLLLTIAAAIIGTVGVVFSIIMIPLSIAASQFGPRLLRTFLRDTGTQVTMGIFTSTFIYCMVVLLHLSTENDHPLPQISVNVALVLGFLSFGVLIYFINHVAVSIQAPVLVAKVSKELHTAIEHDFPDHPDDTFPSSTKNNHSSVDMAQPHAIVMASKSGYVQTRDDSSLVHLAKEHDIVIQVISQPGDFVVQDTALAMMWPDAPLPAIVHAINAAYILSPNRTLVQDVTFGVNQLVEVAIRALSPAINDPFTAINCLDRLGSALCQMCTRTFPQPMLFDQQNKLRLIRIPATFAQQTNAAFNQIREYGRTSTAVTLRMMQTIKLIAQCARTSEQRQALLHHATLVERGCHIGLPEASDQQSISDCYEEVKSLLRQNKI